jgi:hypothetical protein
MNALVSEKMSKNSEKIFDFAIKVALSPPPELV